MQNILIGIVVLLAILAGVSYMTTKTFRAETVVPAPPEKVWAVLMDSDAYAEWNPVFVGIDGTYSQGGSVTNSVKFPEGNVVDMKASVDKLTEARELRQSGGIPLVLTFDHQWLLEPVDGGTKVTQHEIDRGIYLWFWDSSWVQPAYERTVEALRERVVAGQG